MTEANRPSGVAAFAIVWVGQIVSLVGTTMTGLGLPIWVFAQTGRATDLALMGFFYVLFYNVTSLIAGVIVDRSNLKFTMMLSDLASGLATIGILALYTTGELEIWHLFVTAAIQGAFQSFQWPAFSVASTLMIPKEYYTRANSLTDVVGDGARIIAPMLAGALLGALGDETGLQTILLIDVISFVMAVGTLLVVQVPQPKPSAEGRATQGNVLQDLLFGFRYIVARPSLLGLQLVFLTGNFFDSIVFTLWPAMILARTGNDEILFASLQSVAALGRVLGGFALAAWGGFKRRVYGVLLGFFLSGLLWSIPFGLGRPDLGWAGLAIWFGAALLGSAINPLINSSNQAIWQSKVPPDMQGRVFSTRATIAWLGVPISALLAGPLADRLMEPAMQEGGNLISVFGRLVGTGPGAGMGLICVLAGLIVTGISMGWYFVPTVRNAEDILPDHDGAGTNSQEEIGNA